MAFTTVRAYISVLLNHHVCGNLLEQSQEAKARNNLHTVTHVNAKYTAWWVVLYVPVLHPTHRDRNSQHPRFLVHILPQRTSPPPSVVTGQSQTSADTESHRTYARARLLLLKLIPVRFRHAVAFSFFGDEYYSTLQHILVCSSILLLGRMDLWAIPRY